MTYPPFSLTFSPHIPELLYNLNCSLAISTYQAGKLIFISPKDKEQLVQLPRTFNRPMGIALSHDHQKMGIACKDEVILFQNSPDLALHYPKSPKTYDSLYCPRVTFHTGNIDLHDLFLGNGGIYGVNTLFSCIIKLSETYNFIPYWVPPHITKVVSEDRCHLNGMAMADGLPRFATMFNQGDSTSSWRTEIKDGGLVMDITTNEVLTRGLFMPHSPRYHNGFLYVLLSGNGKLIKINPENGESEEVISLGKFVRGMALYGDYAFIGFSRLRKNSSTFAHLKIADESETAGISIVHLPSGSFQGSITYKASVDEIYDVEILPDIIRPNILNTINPVYKQGLSTPQGSFWGADGKQE